MKTLININFVCEGVLIAPSKSIEVEIRQVEGVHGIHHQLDLNHPSNAKVLKNLKVFKEKGQRYKLKYANDIVQSTDGWKSIYSVQLVYDKIPTPIIKWEESANRLELLTAIIFDHNKDGRLSEDDRIEDAIRLARKIAIAVQENIDDNK